MLSHQVSPFKESLMRDHDETPYIVIERDGGGGLGLSFSVLWLGPAWPSSSLPSPGRRPRRRSRPGR